MLIVGMLVERQQHIRLIPGTKHLAGSDPLAAANNGASVARSTRSALGYSDGERAVLAVRGGEVK